MDMKRGVNRTKAMEQWETLKITLEQCGAKVDVMEADVCFSSCQRDVKSSNFRVQTICRIWSLPQTRQLSVETGPISPILPTQKGKEKGKW